MSFETFITCDAENCESRRQVKQPGDMPEGWIFIQYVRSAISLLNGPRNPHAKEQVGKIFCSWRCINSEVKRNLIENVRE